MNANVSIYQDSVKDSSGILTSESNEMGLSTIFNYNGNNVAFIKTSYGILINATDMARPYNKRPVDYLRQMYVNELVSTIVSQTHISEDQLVIKMRGSSENGGGTWLYEDVAIDFAQWLDVKFKVWCNSKIKELLTTGLVKLLLSHINKHLTSEVVKLPTKSHLLFMLFLRRSVITYAVAW